MPSPRACSGAGCRCRSNAALQRLAVQNADDAALAGGEAKLRDAERRVATLAPALAEIETLLVNLEADRAEMLDKRTRTATAAEVSALADDLMQANESFEIANSDLCSLTEKASRFVHEARALEAYAASSKIEVPQAVGIIGELLREYCKMVLNGSAPATLPAKELPFVPEVVTKPPTKHLFALRAISWKENGELRTAQKFTDCDLPVEYVKKAIRSRACCEIGDPMRNPQTINQWGGHPDPSQCFSLDGEPVTDAAEPHEVTLHTAFTPVDRGKPYMVRVAGGAA